MLDRLMGGPVFPEPDGVVGHDVDDPKPHQRGQAYGSSWL